MSGTRQRQLPIPGCLQDQLDIWFIDDTSTIEEGSGLAGSIMERILADKFRQFLEVFHKDDLTLEELDRVHVAYASFAENVTVHFDFNFPVSDIAGKTENFKNYYKDFVSGPSNSGNALRFIVEEAFAPEMGTRPQAQHIVILLVQEVPSVNVQLAREMTAHLRQQDDIRVIVFHTIDDLEKGAEELLPLDTSFHVNRALYFYDTYIRTLCRPCSLGWLAVKELDGYACFKLYTRGDVRMSDYIKSSSVCHDKANLVQKVAQVAHIETESELLALERALYEYSLTNLQEGERVTVHIGLHRQQHRLKQSFGWRNGRPLTYHNWRERRPDGFRQLRCALWDLDKLNPTYSQMSIGTVDRPPRMPSPLEDLVNASKVIAPAEPGGKATLTFDFWKEWHAPGFKDVLCSEKAFCVLCEETFKVTYDARPDVSSASIPSSDIVSQVLTSGQYVLVDQRDNADQRLLSAQNFTSDLGGRVSLKAVSSVLPQLAKGVGSVKVYSLVNLANSNRRRRSLDPFPPPMSSESLETTLQEESQLKEIPLFDCQAEFTQELLPYSRVCDRWPDCSTGRDENICGEKAYKACNRKEVACRSGYCIPEEGMCDLYPDCPDGSDEDTCQDECKHFPCVGVCLPQSWGADGETDCITCGAAPIQDESNTYLSNCVVMCNRTKCLTKDLIQDSKTDCKGPEGSLDKTLGALEGTHCYDRLGRVINNVENTWAPQCVYLKDAVHTLIGCKSFVHLHSCENATCPEGYFKCPKSYCIPLHYVRNQEPDCPYGEDEDLTIITENANFECTPKGEAPPILLHPSLVCDGHAHCPLSDDEMECDVTCRHGFLCGGGAVVVTDYDKTKTLTDFSFVGPQTRWLDISGVQVGKSKDFFMNFDIIDGFRNVLWLNMSNCGLEDVDYDPNLIHSANPHESGEESVNVGYWSENFKTVMTFDLSHNRLKTLENNFIRVRPYPEHNIIGMMDNLQNLNLSHNTDLVVTKTGLSRVAGHLISLDLSYTAVYVLTEDLTDILTSLRILSLEGTEIARIAPTFPGSLQVLDLRWIPLETIDTQPFDGLTEIQQIHASTYKLCCPQIRGLDVPAHACTATGDAISSCDDLIQEPILRVLLWVFGSAALLGNVLVILYRITLDRELLKRGYGIYVLNLSISDLLMGVYLLMIACADLNYRGDYVWHEQAWREGWLCHIAGFLSTWSSESSAIFIFLITLDRFLVIQFPFGQVRISQSGFVVSTVLAWTSGLCLAVVPLLPPFQHWTIYSSNGMCLGLPLTTDRQEGWQFSTAVFVGVNFVLFLLIALGQFAIYRTMSSARIHTEEGMSKFQETRRQQDIAVAKQLSLVVITDFLCWFPIAAMGLLVLAGTELGTDVYAWTAVLVLPINSAINPVLYTVPALKKTFDGLVNKVFGKNPSSESDNVKSSAEDLEATSKYTRQLKALMDSLKCAKDFLGKEIVGKDQIEALQSKSIVLTKELEMMRNILHDKIPASVKDNKDS